MAAPPPRSLPTGPFGVSRLATFAARLDAVNIAVGRAAAWLALAMVLVQFAVVILRYVFSIGFIAVQESIWYMHGMLFMLGAGYTLLHDGHVRIDIIYRDASARYKALVNLAGVLVFLLPVCVVTWWLSWDYVLDSWRVREGSANLGGLPFLYLLKTVIPIFVILLTIQGISLALKSVLVLTGRAPPPESRPAAVQEIV